MSSIGYLLSFDLVQSYQDTQAEEVNQESCLSQKRALDAQFICAANSAARAKYLAR